MRTPEQRRHEKEICKDYLRRAGTLPAARKLAKKDGVTYNTSIWIGALGEMFGDMAQANRGATPPGPRDRRK